MQILQHSKHLIGRISSQYYAPVIHSNELYIIKSFYLWWNLPQGIPKVCRVQEFAVTILGMKDLCKKF